MRITQVKAWDEKRRIVEKARRGASKTRMRQEWDKERRNQVEVDLEVRESWKWKVREKREVLRMGQKSQHESKELSVQQDADRVCN